MDNRIQSIINEEISQATGMELVEAEQSMGIFSWLVRTGETIPPWWSRGRDIRLGQLWKESSHLASAIYNAQSKMLGIPPIIVARNSSNEDHVAEAEELLHLMNATSGFGEGWLPTYAKFIEDYLTQDNGAFLEVIGDGPADGPILGLPLGVRHLDSSRCTRTGHPLYPVIIMGEDSRWYKLFWTRVIYMSQMTSPRREMNGVGLCGVSRCVEVAQTLVDMIRYKQERLGSRPQNQMLVGKGLTGKTIMAALRRVEEEQNSMGFTRYAKTVAVGSENPDIAIEKIDLTHLDPFDEAVSTNLGMYVIAAALGMDADEIWPSAGGSASKGEADLRRMRSRGRLPAQLTGELSKQFNLKVMPPYLKLDFDFKDDEQDQQQAIVRDIRGRNRTRDLENGTMTTHAARRNMLIDEDIDQFTYNDMELGDGRLPDGTTIGVLFFDDDPIYSRHLRFMPDPLLFTPNIIDEQGNISDVKLNEIVGTIQGQRQLVLTELALTTSDRKVDRIKRAYHALDWLEEKYLYAAGRILPEVPTVSRSSRTDIRVAPVEVSPPAGTASPAEAEAGPDSRNTQNVTGND